jgi:hypothetical protein
MNLEDVLPPGSPIEATLESIASSCVYRGEKPVELFLGTQWITHVNMDLKPNK